MITNNIRQIRISPFRRNFLNVAAITMLTLVASQSRATTCEFSSAQLPKEVSDAADSISSGDYEKFIEVIDPNAGMLKVDRENLSSGLEDYSASGFGSCSLLKYQREENFVTAFIFFQEHGATLFAFFALVRIDGSWLFAKTQVSSNFDEVYELVK